VNFTAETIHHVMPQLLMMHRIFAGQSNILSEGLVGCLQSLIKGAVQTLILIHCSLTDPSSLLGTFYESIIPQILQPFRPSESGIVVVLVVSTACRVGARIYYVSSTVSGVCSGVGKVEDAPHLNNGGNIT
jgi:hypothetical protein